MKKEIELIEKLNKISKKNLSPIRGFRMFFKLYFKHLNIFKINYILKPAIVGLSLILLTTSTVYSYNSSSITFGTAAYGVKTGIENIISKTKNGLSKVQYYSYLIDKRVAEVEYLKNKNFNKATKEFSLINVAYAEDNNSYTSSIANTILEISKINKKIDQEIVNIKDETQKNTAIKIFKEKKIKQKKVFDEIKQEKEKINTNKKIDKKILEETIKVIDIVSPTIEVLLEEDESENDNNLLEKNNIDNGEELLNSEKEIKEKKHKNTEDIKIENNSKNNNEDDKPSNQNNNIDIDHTDQEQSEFKNNKEDPEKEYLLEKNNQSEDVGDNEDVEDIKNKKIEDIDIKKDNKQNNKMR